MIMKTLNTKIYNSILFAFMVLTTLGLVSCEDDNVGEFKLTGNIEHLIPGGSYDLAKTVTDDGQYIVFTPELNDNFEYWGLTLKQVEYYIDDALYKTETALPCELMINKSDIEVGTHKLKAVMTVIGDDCDDVVLEKEDVFYISSTGSMSERHGEFYIDYNYVVKGDELVVTPELLVARSSDGCKIDEVRYYWDGSLIFTAASSPFTLKHKINAEDGSSHEIKLVIKYHDRYSDNLTYNWSFSNYKIYTADDSFCTWNIKSIRNDYKNGETISLIAKLFKGANVRKNYEVEFYLDNKIIGKSSTFPYTLDYELNNLSKGSHSIEGKIITKDGDSTISQSNKETIIITE